MAVSLADEAYLAIRDEILRGQLRPGTPLSRRRLARQLGMSVLPVSDGKVVWHENIGRMGGAPATVELDGKQYLLVTGGNSLFAYALP